MLFFKASDIYTKKKYSTLRKRTIKKNCYTLDLHVGLSSLISIHHDHAVYFMFCLHTFTTEIILRQQEEYKIKVAFN